jgi:hypothetical protein
VIAFFIVLAMVPLTLLIVSALFAPFIDDWFEDRK